MLALSPAFPYPPALDIAAISTLHTAIALEPPYPVPPSHHDSCDYQLSSITTATHPPAAGLYLPCPPRSPAQAYRTRMFLQVHKSRWLRYSAVHVLPARRSMNAVHATASTPVRHPPRIDHLRVRRRNAPQSLQHGSICAAVSLSSPARFRAQGASNIS